MAISTTASTQSFKDWAAANKGTFDTLKSQFATDIDPMLQNFATKQEALKTKDVADWQQLMALSGTSRGGVEQQGVQDIFKNYGQQYTDYATQLSTSAEEQGYQRAQDMYGRYTTEQSAAREQTTIDTANRASVTNTANNLWNSGQYASFAEAWNAANQQLGFNYEPPTNQPTTNTGWQTNFDNILSQVDTSLPSATRYAKAQEMYKEQYGFYFGKYNPDAVGTEDGTGDATIPVDAPISESLIGNDGTLTGRIQVTPEGIFIREGIGGKNYTTDQVLNSYLKAEGIVNEDIATMTSTDKYATIATKYNVPPEALNSPQEFMDFIQGKVTLGYNIDSNAAQTFSDNYVSADNSNVANVENHALAEEDYNVLNKAYGEVQTPSQKYQVPVDANNAMYIVIPMNDGSFRRLSREQYNTAKANATAAYNSIKKLEAALTASNKLNTMINNNQWLTKDEWKSAQNMNFPTVPQYVRPSYLI